jgi:hypothetical protein
VRKAAPIARKTATTAAGSKTTTPKGVTAKARASVAARLATIAQTRKPIDDAIVLDPSDEDGQRRAAQALARAKEPTTKTATAKPTAKKTAIKKPAIKKSTSKKPPVKKTTTKTTTAKKSPAKKSTAKKSCAEKTTTTGATASKATTPRTRGPSGVTRTAVDRIDDPPPETGLVLFNRVLGKIEQEILRIESIVDRRGGKLSQRTEAERRARTLASLTKTLAELRRLRADEELQRPLDDDAIPRDLDELRRALSQRLEQLVGDAAQPAAAGDE